MSDLRERAAIVACSAVVLLIICAAFCALFYGTIALGAVFATIS